MIVATGPKLPRPSVGDRLVVRRRAVRARKQDEEIIPVRVKAVARYRVTLEGPEGEKLPWMYEEFDLRSGAPWTSSRSDRPTRSSGYRLHNSETLEWEDRRDRAEAYLTESDLRLWSLRGPLRKAAEADFIGFVNALRRFEGLEEI